MNITRDNLADLMDFDTVIRVHPDGTVTREDGVCAPELYNGELENGEWSLMTGWTRQDGYSGPFMHESELIGGSMADHILTHPGVYVAIVSYADVTDEELDHKYTDAVGWAVAYIDHEAV